VTPAAHRCLDFQPSLPTQVKHNGNISLRDG